MGNDVVDLIMGDHRELERLFDSLLNEPDKRAALVPVMTTLLTAHSRAEESEVYPAAREAGGEDDVEHSQKEHLEADQLALALSRTDPASPDFTTALQQLVDAVRHHVEEEETTVLPGMRERIDEARRAELGEAFLAARQEHLGDQPADITKAELDQQAANAGVTGASSMGKDELKQTLKDAAES
ncbi:hemerythrin domain-containing protein [Nocardioides daeguensis]|uniref:Hemerythrin-like domain-containing protein n=1 Tax=Nocardioides daeguensis TaxID=908359 RepID=A0ABP6UQN2_9ACTN|nr:hemerythrin domain-containing protein [Nocardioides daeguensis]MBV6728285.1 hemerythrin domain-containing protein [Nocardioides daeguensis]MCR1773094.1 hemerythrin domain-containing protein [Nocardioides daeguensis]